MGKLACICGYVHDLTPVPDAGYIVVRDRDYERLVAGELKRAALSGAKADTPEMQELIAADAVVLPITHSRLFECPKCGRIQWQKHETEIFQSYKPDA